MAQDPWCERNAYYLLGPDLDVIDAACAAGDGPALCRWLAVKYLIRAGRKPGESVPKDLRKALAVLHRWLAWEEEHTG